MKIYDIEYEKKTIAYILQNPEATIQIFEKVKEDMFYDLQIKQVFILLQNYWNKYVSIPSDEIFTKILEKEFNEDINKISEFQLLILQLRKEEIKYEELTFTIDYLVDMYLYRKFWLFLDAKTSEVTPNNIRKIYNDMQETFFYDSYESHIRRFDLSENVLDRLKHYERRELTQPGITSGIPALDRETHGWHPGELIVFLSQSGHGKSIVLLNETEYANIAGHNGIFMSLEMSYEENMDRYHSMVSGSPFNKVRKRELNGDELKNYYTNLIARQLLPSEYKRFYEYVYSLTEFNYEELWEYCKKNFKQREHKIYFLDIPRNCTLKLIESEIKNLQKKCNISFVVIDYLTLINSPVRSMNTEEALRAISRELKCLARDLKLPIISACQMHFTKENEDITQVKTRYAKAINENADYVIGWNQSEAEKLNKDLEFEFTKKRHISAIKIPLKADFDMMKIYGI